MRDWYARHYGMATTSPVGRSSVGAAPLSVGVQDGAWSTVEPLRDGCVSRSGLLMSLSSCNRVRGDRNNNEQVIVA